MQTCICACIALPPATKEVSQDDDDDEEMISGMENLSSVQLYTGTGNLKLKRETEGPEDRARNDCAVSLCS